MLKHAYAIKSKSTAKDGTGNKSGASTRSVSEDRAEAYKDVISKAAQNAQSKARLEAFYHQAAAQNLGPLVKAGVPIQPGKPIKPEVVAYHDLQSLVDLYKEAYAVKPAGLIKTKPAIKYEAGIKTGVATRAASVDKDAAYQARLAAYQQAKARLAVAHKQTAGQKLGYGTNPVDLTKTEPAIKVGAATKAELAAAKARLKLAAENVQ